MPTLPVPLFNRVFKNADQSVLTDDGATQYNGFIDALNGLNIRPGEVLASSNGRHCDGIFFWPDKNYLVSVEDGSVYIRTSSGTALADLYSAGAASFGAGKQVSFATDGDRVFMAGGGKISYVSSTGTLTELAAPDAPTTVSQLAYLDGYILAITGTDKKFWWSDVNDGTSWTATNFASSAGNPDNTIAIRVVQRQIYLFGSATTEIWENDGNSPFSRIPGGLIEIGCAAKNSPVRQNNSLIWLSDKRQFVRFTGTDTEFISSRYDKEIAEFASVSDCVGATVVKGGQEYCLFYFPTQKRTLAYNPAIDDWSEWGTWIPETLEWAPYEFTSVARDVQSGQVYVGKPSAVGITCLSLDSRTDYPSAVPAGTSFKFLRTTGHIDHGSSKNKRLEELRFRARRGAASSSITSTILMLRYRNDGDSTWSPIREIDLGAVGDTNHHIRLKRLGMYRSRQWEISATDNMRIVLSNAEADFTELR